MKIKIPIILAMSAILLTSCTRLGLRITMNKSLEKQLSILYNKDQDKYIALIPMTHVGYEKFYDDVKLNIDTLRAAGYKIYFEEVRLESTTNDPKTRDSLERKMRRLIGYYPTQKLKKYASLNDKFVRQNYDTLGVSEALGDANLDYTFEELVIVYEQNKGEIKLTECDYTTPLDAEYNCKKDKSIDHKYAIHTLRNQLVIDTLLNANAKKMALIYGKGHVFDIGMELQANNYAVLRKGRGIPNIVRLEDER